MDRVPRPALLHTSVRVGLECFVPTCLNAVK
jgi:hypothetical protein